MENEPLDPDETDLFVDWLIESGILVEDGFDADGELTYEYNFNLMKTQMPEMYEEMMAGINEGLMSLYEQGLVKIEYDEQLQAHFGATEEGMKFFKEKGY